MWPPGLIARDAAAFDCTPLVDRDASSGEGAAWGVALEPENDSGVVAEVTLVCVAMGEVVSEPGQHKSNCAGLTAMDLVSGISNPPPMMKSKALLDGEALVTQLAWRAFSRLR